MAITAPSLEFARSLANRSLSSKVTVLLSSGCPTVVDYSPASAATHSFKRSTRRRGSRLGVLIPRTASGGWICIGADGHYRGSEGIEAEFVYVALHKDGSQTLHTPAEFQQQFEWKNDPSKATF